MSVINKMLRDLDQRQSPLALDAANGTARAGTASVGMNILSDLDAPNTRSRAWWVGAMGLVAAAAIGTWLLVWAPTTVHTPRELRKEAAATPMAAPAIPLAAASSPAIATAPPGPASSAPVAPDAAPSATMNLRMEQSLSARRALDALLSAPETARATPAKPTAAPAVAAVSSAPAVAAAPAGVPAPLATAAERTKARAPLSNAASSSSTGDNNAPTIQRQQQAGGDAMAQAQSLWNSGSHDAAMDLMQQSIAAAERSVKAGTATGSSTLVLVPLVREMARMQLAEGRYGAVWEMLVRLERLLGNPPDLWAIRANAAQRLGHHPDSVHAYMMALQTRPDEQRWLLGAAVSLAALGKTTSAAEMAEKARAAGPVSTEILAYLRQAGVPLREQ